MSGSRQRDTCDRPPAVLLCQTDISEEKKTDGLRVSRNAVRFIERCGDDGTFAVNVVDTVEVSLVTLSIWKDSYFSETIRLNSFTKLCINHWRWQIFSVEIVF